MRVATRRTAVATATAMVAMLSLTACFIPGPPPVPQPTPIAPIEPVGDGQTIGGEVREGRVPSGGTVAVDLVLDERAAVLIGATSTDDEDLTLLLEGEGIELDNDDGRREPDAFAFPLASNYDPVIGAVLEPGAYTITVGEWGDDASGFQLQVLTGTLAVEVGSTTPLQVGPGEPALVMLPAESQYATVSDPAGVRSWVTSTDQRYGITDEGLSGERLPLPGGEGRLLVVHREQGSTQSGTVELTIE